MSSASNFQHTTQILVGVTSLLVFITCAAAQSPAIDTKLAAQYFRQLKETSDRDGAKTWGVTLYGPLMFVDPRSHNIVTNQADLEEFRSLVVSYEGENRVDLQLIFLSVWFCPS